MNFTNLPNKQLYLIRHGQTVEKSLNIKQTPESILSQEGQQQAYSIAQVLAQTQAPFIISSDLPRARQTAQIFADETKRPIIISEKIHEFQRPLEYYISPDNSDYHKRYIAELIKNWGNLDWKFEDKGESHKELLSRANRFKDIIMRGDYGDEIIIVSHGDFLRAFLFLVLFKSFDTTAYFQFIRSIEYDNCRVSLLQHFPQYDEWKLKYHNSGISK